MATRFIFGKKGGGKSYLAAKWLVEELRHGNRDVVTNLAVDIPALARYLEDYCPDAPPGAWRRVRILETEQLKDWFRYRGRIDLEPIREGHGAEWGLMDWTPCIDQPPVLYIIDEAHIPFGAREFAKTGKAVFSFLSQSRKLGDEVVLISQRPEQVDKQMRGQVDEWTHTVNFGNLAFLSWFKMPKRLVWTSYASLPSGLRREPAQARGIIRVDPRGIGSVYDTNAGVGVKGSGEPPKRERKLSLWWLLPIPLLAWMGCKSGMAAIQSGASRLLPGSPPTTNATPQRPTPAPTNLLQHVAAQVLPPILTTTTSALAIPSRPAAPLPPPPVCIAWHRIGSQASATLSDGSTWTPDTGLERVAPNGIRILGTNYAMHTPTFNTRQTTPNPLTSP